MAIALWPADLPQDVLRGYSFRFAALSVSSPTDQGPGKKRRRFTGNSRPFTVTARLTRAQVPVLETFWATTLAGGVLPFEWRDPIDKSSRVFRFRGDDPPAPRHEAGNEYRVELALDALPS